MAKFEVLRADKEKTITKIEFRRDENGNKVPVQREYEVTMKVGAYGYEDINVGDILELEGHLAEKARGNTEYFREVVPHKGGATIVKTHEVHTDAGTPRRGRKKKNAAA